LFGRAQIDSRIALLRYGQQPIINSGTLTCTVSDVPGSNGTIELACNFKPQAGVAGDYIGTAETKSAGLPPAKHVLMWTVVATDAGNALMLDGTFSAEAGRQGPALIGGRSGAIRLEPITKQELAGPADITMLTLKLAATKT
jgi:hypothetical protein